MKKISYVITYLALFATVVWGVASASQYKFNKLRTEKYNGVVATAAEREQQLSCLARNIYYEAGHEPFEGKVAVAQVTMNRVESGKFPADVCKTVYQKNVIYDKVVCQFSWFCEVGPKSRPLHGAAYAESMEAAKKVLLENFRLPSLKDALYYHADYVNPQWNKPKLAKIGRHIFYGERI